MSEDVESFRRRARDWIRQNLRLLDDSDQRSGLLTVSEDQELAVVTRSRELQRMFYEAGFAGICFPTEYGGLGLTPLHQKAFNEELAGYEWPMKIAVPTFSPCAAILLEFGTEEQRRRHIPAILRGEEIWMQLLSEPAPGSLNIWHHTSSPVNSGRR